MQQIVESDRGWRSLGSQLSRVEPPVESEGMRLPAQSTQLPATSSSPPSSEGASGRVGQVQDPREGLYSYPPRVVACGGENFDALYQQALLPSLQPFVQGSIAMDLLPRQLVRDRKELSIVGAWFPKDDLDRGAGVTVGPDPGTRVPPEQR